MEPYRPSRWELIGGRRNWRSIGRHYAVQVPPMIWPFIKKHQRAVLCVAAACVGAVIMGPVSLHFEEKRRLREAQKERADLLEAKILTERALLNWIHWRDTFLGSQVAVCFHAHNFVREGNRGKPSFYSITCQIGPKGVPPSKQVKCDQDLCRIDNLK